MVRTWIAALVCAVVAAAAGPAAAPPRSSPSARRVVTALRCVIEGPARPLFPVRGADADQALRQRVVVQNLSGAPLLNGDINFTVGLLERAGREQPVASVPRSILAGERLQVGWAYLAKECEATFTRTLPAG